jgi:hypothetical protein
MTSIAEIRDNTVDIIDLTARDLDNIANEMAMAIRDNTSATQLILTLCDFNDRTFEILIDAICQRQNRFIYVDISFNQKLTKQSYAPIATLINSKKVDDLNIANIDSITLNKEYTEKLIALAQVNSVTLYINDKARAELQLTSDKLLFRNSIFQPRDFRVITQNLSQILNNPETISKIFPKLSKFLILSLCKAAREATKSVNEEKESMNEKPFLISNFKDPRSSKATIDELPLFIRYKLMDIIIENNLDHCNNASVERRNDFKL